jgi:soluble lytic murein transglycosylase-like protein
MKLINTIVSISCYLLCSISSAEPLIQQTRNQSTVEFSNISQQNTTGPKTRIYKTESDSVPSFSNIKPTDTDYEVLHFDCFACNPNSSINWYQVKLNRKAYKRAVDKAAQKYSVDAALVRAIIHAESAFKKNAKSSVGAIGLMQLMPATAKELGVSDSLNPDQNINGGAKYLAQLHKQFKGDLRLTAAAYNAGPNAVRKYNGIPPYKETQVYVERVMILHQRYGNKI